MMPADTATHSYWQRASGAYTPEPPLAGDLTADVVVIGGGYTGLSTAWNLKTTHPGMTVAVLEADVVGFGASGRNGGFVSESFGLIGITDRRFGRQRLREGLQYVHRGAEYLRDIIMTHGLDSDYETPGVLAISFTAITPRVLDELLREFDAAGYGDNVHVRDRAWLQQEFGSPMFRHAIELMDSARINPLKHVRALKRLAVAAGVAVYEHTPAEHIAPSPRVTVKTPAGTVTADKCVLATNGYTHLLSGVPGVTRKQIPGWSYQIVTAPLTPAQREAVGWKQRQGLNTLRTMLHYTSLTRDGRIVFGGGDIGFAYGRRMDVDRNEKVWAKMYGHLTAMFPAVNGIRIDDRWGGPTSLASEMAPIIGTLASGRIVYSVGCSGHGIALTHLNGKTLADLVTGVRSELTDLWFVNRTAIPWPPSWLTYPACQVVRGALNLLDAYHERGVWK